MILTFLPSSGGDLDLLDNSICHGKKYHQFGQQTSVSEASRDTGCTAQHSEPRKVWQFITKVHFDVQKNYHTISGQKAPGRYQSGLYR